MDPHYLNDEDILSIIREIPDIDSKFKEIGTVVSISERILVEKLLKKEKLYPGAIPHLIKMIKQKILTGSIDPGVPVGIAASTAIGEPVTQMTLNSKRSSGVKKTVTESFSKVKELLNVSIPKYQTTTLCLAKRNPTLDDIINFRVKYVELLFSDIVSSFDILKFTDFKMPDWVQEYLGTIGGTIPIDVKNVLILKFDVIKLIKNRVLFSSIKGILEKSASVFCVYSPLYEGTVIVFPNETFVQQTMQKELSEKGSVFDPNEVSAMYFNSSFVPGLMKIRVKGIEGIREVFPSFINYTIFFEDEVKTDFHGIDVWKVVIDPVRFRMYNIDLRYFDELFTSTGMEVLDIRDEEYLSGEYEYADPPTIFTLDTSRVRPSSIFHDIVKEEKSDTWIVEMLDGKELPKMQGVVVEKFKDENDVVVPNVYTVEINLSPRNIIDAVLGENARYIYADITGINTSELVLLPEVDPYHLYTNSLRDIHATLGIEAARVYFIDELLQVISRSGIYINPKHVELLADMMTNLGFVNKLTITGMISKNTGPLDTATFERAAAILASAAAFNVTQSTDTVSTSILLGKKAKIGSGLSEVLMDREKYNSFLVELEERKNIPGPVQEVNIKRALDELKEKMLQPLAIGFAPMNSVPEIESVKSFRGSIREEKRRRPEYPVQPPRSRVGETAASISTDAQFVPKVLTRRFAPPEPAHAPAPVPVELRKIQEPK